MIDIETYRLIDKYLNDTLTIDEKENFEMLINSNSEIREEFSIQKNLFSIIGDSDEEIQQRLQIKKKIQNIGKRYHRKRITIFRQRLAIAASIIILIGIGYNIFNNKTQSLYDDYVNWNELPSLTHRAENTNNLAQAEIYFLNKEYNNAIIEFENYIREQGNNPQVFAYLGAAYTEITDYENAIKAFDNLEKGNSLDSNKAFWYKAIVYLKMDDEKNSIKMLNLIVQKPNHFKYNEAKELLERLQ